MDIEEYILSHTSAEPAYLQQIVRSTYLHELNPHMLSGHLQGRLLSALSHMIRPKRILELGTYTGYSALCLAEGLRDEQSRLITIEHNDELEDTILHNLALSDLSSKITLIIGDAAQVLSCGNELIAEQPFDLVFIDADKRQYEQYYNLVFDMVRPGGFILADNTLWDGHVVDPAYDKDKQTMALRRFNDKIAADERVETFILPLRDGLTFIRKL